MLKIWRASKTLEIRGEKSPGERMNCKQIELNAAGLSMGFSDHLNRRVLARVKKYGRKEIPVTTLYACLGSGNCFKPWLVSHQLGLPLDVRLIDVLQGKQKKPDYLSINPLGVVPYLTTKTGKGIGESNAMIWYLAEGSALMPTTPEDRAEALQWMFFEQSKLEPFISPARFFTTILPDQKAARADDIANWQAMAEPGLARLNTHLETREFILASGYSIADIAVFGYVHLIDEAGLSMDDFPDIKRWVGSVAATNGFQPIQNLGRSQQQAA